MTALAGRWDLLGIQHKLQVLIQGKDLAVDMS